MTDAGDVIWRNGRPEEVATHYSGHLIEKNRFVDYSERSVPKGDKLENECALQRVVEQLFIDHEMREIF